MDFLITNNTVYLIMKVSLFNNFGARNSVPVFQAIRQGLSKIGHTVVEHDMDADAAVIWSVLWHGRMAKNQAVWNHFRNTNRPVIVAEVGMIHRGTTWKIGVNGTDHSCYNLNITDKKRSKRLGLRLQPWQGQGENILIAVQRQDSHQWSSQPPMDQWLNNTVQTIKQYSDRPIVVRLHPRQKVQVPANCHIQTPIKIQDTYDDFDFDKQLAKTWALVNWNSGPGSQAIIKGVPAFVGPMSLASSVANLDLSQIEKPVRPDREHWLNQLAHTEWTVEEIATGAPILRLEPF
jgi:hypothetical protein